MPRRRMFLPAGIACAWLAALLFAPSVIAQDDEPLGPQTLEVDEAPHAEERVDDEPESELEPELDPEPPAPPPLVQGQERALRRSLIGMWAQAVGTQTLRLRFSDDGSFHMSGTAEDAGTFTLIHDRLTLVADGGATTYQLAFPIVNNASGDQLVLTDSGGRQQTFTRETDLGAYAEWLWDFEPTELGRRAARIGVILLVVFAAWAFIQVLQFLSWLLVFSQWGPLRFMYRARKNRTRTLHSLVLNLVKYVIYFSALGLILTELGINYKTYLASLSVIGLAIGFGSQGLVQDMVTGFFVIFENQYDVGDMVEISGQTGVVEDVGLRMTSLRNYVGQRVVIPNRNIAVVGRFTKGAQHATVDVAVKPEDIARGGERMQDLADELARQFPGVILKPPVLAEPLSLATGEHFARLHLALWPLQTWIVDQQLMPRLRELFKHAGVEIPGDRVSVHYHSREVKPAPSFGKVLRRLGERFDSRERQ